MEQVAFQITASSILVQHTQFSESKFTDKKKNRL